MKKIARIYATQNKTAGCVYIVKRQDNHIGVNKELMKTGGGLDEKGKSLGSRFYEYAKEIAIPHGVKREEIIGCYRVNKDKKYEEN